MPSQKRTLVSGASANVVKEAMFSKRTAVKTKKQYNSKIKTLVQYIRQEELSSTALDDDGTLKLPIARGILLDFFSYNKLRLKFLFILTIKFVIIILIKATLLQILE